jgi:hypothetical protein
LQPLEHPSDTPRIIRSRGTEYLICMVSTSQRNTDALLMIIVVYFRMSLTEDVAQKNAEPAALTRATLAGAAGSILILLQDLT